MLRFSEDKNKHIRRRSITILAQLPTLPHVPASFWDRLNTEEANSNWFKLVQILSRHDNRRMNNWILNSWKILDKRRLRRILRTIDLTEEKWLPMALSILDAPSRLGLYKFFEILSRYATRDQVDAICSKYHGCNVFDRSRIIKNIQQIGFRGINPFIAAEILQSELDVVLLIKLASIWIGFIGPGLEFAYEHISFILNKSIPMSPNLIETMQAHLDELNTYHKHSPTCGDTIWLIKYITDTIERSKRP